ncbi:MAG: hypothetical protein LBJ63_05570 [Prevotellaceae bacterium]|jgi:hypothetical protein|nr:hypothetical protein [Prevotellaceae bacterium]
MKKYILILVAMICLGFSANADSTPKHYCTISNVPGGAVYAEYYNASYVSLQIEKALTTDLIVLVETKTPTGNYSEYATIKAGEKSATVKMCDCGIGFAGGSSSAYTVKVSNAYCK